MLALGKSSPTSCMWATRHWPKKPPVTELKGVAASQALNCREWTNFSQALYMAVKEVRLSAPVICAINDAQIEAFRGLEPIMDGVLAVCGRTRWNRIPATKSGLVICRSPAKDGKHPLIRSISCSIETLAHALNKRDAAARLLEARNQQGLSRLQNIAASTVVNFQNCYN